jgi:hypothetical protein
MVCLARKIGSYWHNRRQWSKWVASKVLCQYIALSEEKILGEWSLRKTHDKLMVLSNVLFEYVVPYETSFIRSKVITNSMANDLPDNGFHPARCSLQNKYWQLIMWQKNTYYMHYSNKTCIQESLLISSWDLHLVAPSTIAWYRNNY